MVGRSPAANPKAVTSKFALLKSLMAASQSSNHKNIKSDRLPLFGMEYLSKKNFYQHFVENQTRVPKYSARFSNRNAKGPSTILSSTSLPNRQREAVNPVALATWTARLLSPEGKVEATIWWLLLQTCTRMYQVYCSSKVKQHNRSIIIIIIIVLVVVVVVVIIIIIIIVKLRCNL